MKRSVSRRRIRKLKPRREMGRRASGMQYIIRADVFLQKVRRNEYPNARWLANAAGIKLLTAQRFIRAIKDELGAPLVYDPVHYGYRLKYPGWKLSGLWM